MDLHKPVVALDMDNTTIFAPRKFYFEDGEYSPLLRAIDRLGKHSSYMTDTACELFLELTQIATVVVVTARSLKQYERLVLPPESKIDYSVCSNGLEVTTPQGFDTDWEIGLRQTIADSSIPLDSLKAMVFNSLSLKGLKPTKDKGNLVLSAHVPDDKDPEVFLKALTQILVGTGYSCSLQGAKINIYPLELSKDKGLKRVFEHMGGIPEYLIVAGDSMMDIPIMSMAQKCYYPVDGEIPLNQLPNNTNVTEAYGIRAGEEILRNIVRDVKSFKSQQGLLF